MNRYIIRRILQAIPVFFTITILYFVLINAIPGGPMKAYMMNPDMQREDIERLERNLGLYDPLPIRYVKWLWAAVRLDLGRSYFTHEPVIDEIAARLPATLQLNIASLILGVVIGVPLGINSALRRATMFDNSVRFTVVLLNAAPGWWVGLLCIVAVANIYTATGVRLFPSGGLYTLATGGHNVLDRLWHLTLPALIAATGGWVTYTRFLRSEVLEVIRQDYVRTAYAKGLSQRVVLYGHILRNALIPIVTLSSGLLAGLIGGAAIYEQIFSWPGIGRLTLDAALKRDYPVMLGTFFISTVLVIISYILADIAYSWVDPRVRYD
jgi:peptide/nickel transport system permease protein